MRSILEGKIYLIRNFQKEKLNNLIINNKLTLRIFLQNQSLYRKEHLKYLLSGIDTSVEENSTKKSTVLLFNSLVNRRGSLLSLLDSKSTCKEVFLGTRRMSSRRLIGVIPPPIDTSQPSPGDSEHSPARWSPNPPCPPIPSNIPNGRNITDQTYPPLPDGSSIVSEEEEGEDSDTETTEGEDENCLDFAISPVSQEEAPFPPLPASPVADAGGNIEPTLTPSASEIIVRGAGTLITVVWEWFTGSSG